MDINIKANLKPISAGDFNYSNIESPYSANTLYFTKDGEPHMIVSGEIHFSRVPAYRWRETLLKMKASGLNAVATYVFWNHHEEIKGKFDFSGDRDIAKFLSVCKELELPVVMRIGPWCHGEAIRGGFPKRIDMLHGKRTNNKKYLEQVREYWTGLYKEVAPFLDGKTVIGIQLENEYTGSTEHIRTLRKIAEEIGFKTPFFTMTAWPSGVPDRDFLPTMGGYPDGPWMPGKKALEPNHRFTICAGKTEGEIGADHHKNNQSEGSVYDYVPFATCETGPGNQVTQHRRPFICEKDGYGVGFAKFASGCNWLGYYMYCGGRNPNDRMYQENKLTFYPNNYQIIDYDFQAPIGRYGDFRAHNDRLRLLHLFATNFDPLICTKQACFPNFDFSNPYDVSKPSCSVRVNEKGEGYVFVSSYEKGLTYGDFRDVRISVEQNGIKTALPPFDILSGSMFFFPFNITVGTETLDAIVAQPIARTDSGELYFAVCPGAEPAYYINGEKFALNPGENEIGGKTVFLLNEDEAKTFYLFGGKAHFAKGTAYEDENGIVCESADGFIDNIKIEPNDLTNRFGFAPTWRRPLKYNYFLYSTGRRAFYSLKMPKNILDGVFDIELVFDFKGLNLQVFSGGKLINDYFNIDGKFIMRLRDYEEYIRENGEFIIKTVPKTRHGVSDVYNEIPLPIGSTELRLLSAKEIRKVRV